MLMMMIWHTYGLSGNLNCILFGSFMGLNGVWMDITAREYGIDEYEHKNDAKLSGIWWDCIGILYNNRMWMGWYANHQMLRHGASAVLKLCRCLGDGIAIHGVSWWLSFESESSKKEKDR